MKEVENNNTEQALTPAIKEGAGIFLMTSHKLVLCESPIEFVKALQGVADYEPIILVKGQLATLHAEMARYDMINTIWTLNSQEIYDNMSAQNKLIKTIEIMPSTLPDWSRGTLAISSVDIAEDSSESILQPLNDGSKSID